MNDPQIYAPDYLRGQSDKQLHYIADMIEDQIRRLKDVVSVGEHYEAIKRITSVTQAEIGEAYHKGLNDRQDEIDHLENDLKLADESYQKLCAVNAKLKSDLALTVQALERIAFSYERSYVTTAEEVLAKIRVDK